MGKNESFCQQPSKAYLRALEACEEDPRSLAGTGALVALNETGQAVQPLDARAPGGSFLRKIVPPSNPARG